MSSGGRLAVLTGILLLLFTAIAARLMPTSDGALDKFNRVAEDMTFEEVSTILGEPDLVEMPRRFRD